MLSGLLPWTKPLRTIKSKIGLECFSYPETKIIRKANIILILFIVIAYAVISLTLITNQRFLLNSPDLLHYMTANNVKLYAIYASAPPSEQ